MTRTQPIRLAAPYQFIEVEVAEMGTPTGGGGGYVLETMNNRSGEGTVVGLRFAEENAKAVLAAIRKHKAQIKRDAAKNEESKA